MCRDLHLKDRSLVHTPRRIFQAEGTKNYQSPVSSAYRDFLFLVHLSRSGLDRRAVTPFLLHSSPLRGKGVWAALLCTVTSSSTGAWGPWHLTKDLTQKLLDKASVKYSDRGLDILAPASHILADAETITRCTGSLIREELTVGSEHSDASRSSSYLVLFAHFLFGTKLRTGRRQHLSKTMIPS